MIIGYFHRLHRRGKNNSPSLGGVKYLVAWTDGPERDEPRSAATIS